MEKFQKIEDNWDTFETSGLKKTFVKGGILCLTPNWFQQYLDLVKSTS